MFACCHFYFRLELLLIIIHITCISLSLRRTSAPIHLTSVLGVLGTQETSCILIAGLLERDIFDLYLPEFDKPWVIHLRETCCCSTNLCSWRPNTVYRNRRMRRHHPHYQKLAYGVFTTARKLRHYFSAHPIIVVNEAPLSNILNNPEATGHVSLWGIELSPRDITYEKRKSIKSQIFADFVAEWMELQNTGPPDLSRT